MVEGPKNGLIEENKAYFLGIMHSEGVKEYQLL
jgi:hypothetical protein